MEDEKTLVLIDGSSLAFRSFFALFNSGLRTKEGLPTWAILGFFNSLFELIEKHKPEMLAVSFDMAEPTFRHIEFKEYKAHRPEMPDDLSAQWPLIKEGVEKLGLPVYELAGYEADDIIGTIAKTAAKDNLNVLILTGDQDAFQLIDGDGQNTKIKVLMPGKQGLQLYGRQEVFDKLGVWPEQIADYKGLCGDSSDNIPGVRGIGPKTAQQLLSTYGDVEQIYKHIDEIKAKGVQSKLIEGRDSAFQSKGLATVQDDVPIKLDLNHCHLTPPNIETLSDFFSKLDFKNLVSRLPKVLKNFNLEVDDAITPTVEKKESVLPVEPITPLPDNAIINTEAQLTNLIETLQKQSAVSVFIQAIAEEQTILGYALAWSENKSSQSVYIPIKQLAITLTNQQGLDRQLVNEKLAKIFQNPEINKIVHNSKYALNLLSHEKLSLENISFDPMLASYICFPDQKHDIHDQAARLLKYPMQHRAGELKQIEES